MSLKILHNNKAVGDIILEALLPEINKRFLKSIPRIRSAVIPIFRKYIVGSDVSKSLIGADAASDDSLLANFGIPFDGDKRINAIINAILNTIVIQHIPFTLVGDNIEGGLELHALSTHMEEVLLLQEGIILSSQGSIVPWLQWLLLRGDETILSDYRIKFISNTSSRTGLAIMILDTKGIGWSVPSKYSGTINDNWLTRTLTDPVFESELIDGMIQVMEGVM